jgi:hypothetical protein
MQEAGVRTEADSSIINSSQIGIIMVGAEAVVIIIMDTIIIIEVDIMGSGSKGEEEEETVKRGRSMVAIMGIIKLGIKLNGHMLAKIEIQVSNQQNQQRSLKIVLQIVILLFLKFIKL